MYITQNPTHLEIDRPQHDLTAACVIAQEYSSATFVSMCCHFGKEKFGSCQVSSYLFIDFVSLELFNFELCACVCVQALVLVLSP
jgi:hypothetical protein